MSVVLYRVDERLIHGQVVVGWGARLGVGRIIVVDDALAVSRWEQELYAMGTPAGVEAEFVTVAGAVDGMPRWKGSDERIFVLTRDVATMERLARAGVLQDVEVNVGGIHYAPGRSQVLRYVFLNDDERRGLLAIRAHGAQVAARDVPGARTVPLDDLVKAS